MVLVIVFFAVVMMAVVVVVTARRRSCSLGTSASHTFPRPSRVDGKSPYPALDDPILEDQKGYVYPPQLAPRPHPADAASRSVCCRARHARLACPCSVSTLRVFGVRDFRCYAAALLWVPSVSGVLLGNISIPFAFARPSHGGIGTRVWPAAWALGLAISAKLLMWPLLVWTPATRRWRVTIWAVMVGVRRARRVGVIGFDGLTGYPDLLQRLSDIQSERSYSLVGMAAYGRAFGSTVGQGAHSHRWAAG